MELGATGWAGPGEQPSSIGFPGRVVMVTHDRTVTYELANESRPSSAPRLQAGGAATARSGPRKKEVPGRPAEEPGAGSVTRARASQSRRVFPTAPPLDRIFSPPLAHFARRSGWAPRHFRIWSRRRRRHLVCVEKEAPAAAGRGRRFPPREAAAAFLPRGSPWVVPHPPSLRGQHVVKPQPPAGDPGSEAEASQASEEGRKAGRRGVERLRRRTSEGGRGAMSEPTPAEAGAAGAREDACRDYQSSLEDLTFNSKPHINMLTILAEENLPFAKEIVSLIEAQTAKVFIHPAASYSSHTP